MTKPMFKFFAVCGLFLAVSSCSSAPTQGASLQISSGTLHVLLEHSSHAFVKDLSFDETSGILRGSVSSSYPYLHNDRFLSVELPDGSRLPFVSEADSMTRRHKRPIRSRFTVQLPRN